MLYLYVKHLHVFFVAISIALFIFRGGLMFMDSKWLQLPLLKYTPHLVDTLLLASAIWLMFLIHQYPIAQSWLTVKVVLLLVYIVLGSFALKRGRSKFQRAIYFALALTVVLFMVSVARAHQPLGWFYG
ncbi:MAG: SirB2 family protein [Gammaproteobacteria bacterium]|nr:SirB2 family protein [Gammaproteobacteria bacterium]